MRLTSSLFVSALIRRLFADGLVATIEQKGAEQAGAIFIRVLKRNRQQMLLFPAPQSFFNDKAQERMFEVRLENVSEAEVDARLGREKTFDDNIWIVEIETDRPETYLDLVSLR